MTVVQITEALAQSVADKATAAPRRRMNYNFHTSDEDNPHRFLNVLLRGTYIRPHRHSDPAKAESFVALKGEVEVLIFDDEGTITQRHALGRVGPDGMLWGVDLQPGVWHTVVALSDVVVCFEVKPGPWYPASDKEFAPWAPAEGDASVSAYQAKLAEGR
ncbi:MAG TPA: WbuC family cupin fold metalloprotein [Capsulimonadaceae bacterium]|jgi:cupin fold WbuC family metalloprotein